MGRLRSIFIVSYNRAWEGWVGKLTTDGVSLACQVRSLALVAHMLQMFNTRMRPMDPTAVCSLFLQY